MDDPSNRYSGIYYDPKSPASLKDLDNSQLFLGTAEQKVANFSSSLFDAVIPLMLERIKRGGSLPGPESPDLAEYQSRILDAIRVWAKSFNIDVGWVWREALDAVYLKLFSTAKGMASKEFFGVWRRNVSGSRSRTFELPAWDPLVESAAHYIGRADHDWRTLRDEHISTAKDQLRAGKLKPMPRRRKRRIDPELRFEWAALHRCAGKSIEALADQYFNDTEVIRISVSRILRDLGLELPT